MNMMTSITMQEGWQSWWGQWRWSCIASAPWWEASPIHLRGGWNMAGIEEFEIWINWRYYMKWMGIADTVLTCVHYWRWPCIAENSIWSVLGIWRKSQCVLLGFGLGENPCLPRFKAGSATCFEVDPAMSATSVLAKCLLLWNYAETKQTNFVSVKKDIKFPCLKFLKTQSLVCPEAAGDKPPPMKMKITNE